MKQINSKHMNAQIPEELKTSCYRIFRKEVLRVGLKMETDDLFQEFKIVIAEAVKESGPKGKKDRDWFKTIFARCAFQFSVDQKRKEMAACRYVDPESTYSTADCDEIELARLANKESDQKSIAREVLAQIAAICPDFIQEYIDETSRMCGAQKRDIKKSLTKWQLQEIMHTALENCQLDKSAKDTCTELIERMFELADLEEGHSLK